MALPRLRLSYRLRIRAWASASFEFYNWYGLHTVKGVPTESLKILRETIGQAMKDQQFVDAMEKIQTPITYMNAKEFQTFLEKNAKKLMETIQRIRKVG